MGVVDGVGGVEVAVVSVERRATPRQVKKSILCNGKCTICSFVVV